MKYICDEIILVTKYEKLHTYFKTKVVGGSFRGQYYWYTSIQSKAIWKFKSFGWNFIKNICLKENSAIKAKYFMYLKKNQYQMKEKEIL